MAVTTSYKSQSTLDCSSTELSASKRMTGVNRDGVLGASLILSIVSLALLLGVTWHLQSSLNLQQQQVEHDRKLLLELQDQDMGKVYLYITLVQLHTYVRTYICTISFELSSYLYVIIDSAHAAIFQNM